MLYKGTLFANHKNIRITSFVNQDSNYLGGLSGASNERAIEKEREERERERESSRERERER